MSLQQSKQLQNIRLSHLFFLLMMMKEIKKSRNRE